MLPRRVLFIGAHTDDIELMAGGFLHRVRRLGKAAHVMAFSSHRGITDHAKAAAEFKANMMSLGVTYDLLDLEACSEGPGGFQAMRDLIYQVVREKALMMEADLAVTHPECDTNQDHQQVRAEVLRALKGVCSIVSGEYPFNQVSGRVPDMFVELSVEDIDVKTRLINGYESQKAPHRHYFDPDAWRGLARMRGAQIGKPYAEGFFVDRLVM